MMPEKHCANWIWETKGCLGAFKIIDRGRRMTAHPLDRCLVVDGKECEYFDKIVVPGIDAPKTHRMGSVSHATEKTVPRHVV